MTIREKRKELLDVATAILCADMCNLPTGKTDVEFAVKSAMQLIERVYTCHEEVD